MDYVKIKCGNCHHKHIIYGAELDKEGVKRVCPYCFTPINQKTMQGILEGYKAMHDLNYQALKSHNEYATPLFEVEYKYKGEN